MTIQEQAAPAAPLPRAHDADGTTATATAHFVFVPLNERGHLIPAVDTALLLATHGAHCTIVGPPSTAARVRHTVDAARRSGLPVRLAEFPLDYAAAGLPEGADHAAERVAPAHTLAYYRAVALLRAPAERYLRAQPGPRPTCVVADVFNPWAAELAAGLGVPRLSFFSMCAFSVLCQHNLERFHAFDGAGGDEPVVVPGIERRVAVTRAQAPGFLRGIPIPEWEELADYIERARAEADGVVMNTVLEIEPEYVAGYAAARGMKVWTVGPVSLYHHQQQQGAAAAAAATTLASRGNNSTSAAADAADCLRWLDGVEEPGSVVYVSFGSISRTDPKQVVELGLGLEASGHPFVWVVRSDGAGDAAAGEATTRALLRELEATTRAFLRELEARVAGRGLLLINGWAPQVAILSHPAVGGFVTHCGWNSTLEAVAAGVPLVTWPHFTDQFLNEKMAVEVLGVGVGVGVTEPLMFQAVRKEIVVGRGVVEEAVRSVMGGGEEAEGRRRRARELAAKASSAMEGGGSSRANLRDLVKRFEVGPAAAVGRV